MDEILKNFGLIFPEINRMLSYGILIFIRLIGFVRFAPVFNRKEIPGMIKLSFAFIVAVILTIVLKPNQIVSSESMFLQSILNFVFGAMLGWMANCIVLAVEAGGDMINMQMGVSSAQIMDPTTQGMVSLMGRLFSLIGLLLFIHVGGIYWLFKAFLRGFEVFPIFSSQFPLTKVFELDNVITITSNLLYMGLQIASPVLLATMGQDIILGVISKTAPQINVFQLSFLFKPVFGVAILMWIMPILIDIINDYFTSFSNIF